MAKYTWDHIHLRTTNPEATAAWYERMLGAEVIRTKQQGASRIDLKLGGANIFIAPVTAGDGVNPPPKTPYQGLDHFGLTVTGIEFAFLIGGLVVTETVFNLPGVARFLVQAISWRDYPIVQNLVMFISIVVILSNLTVDMLYGVLDPRVRYGG